MTFHTTLLALACAAGLMAGSQDPTQIKNAPASTVSPVAFQTYAEGTYFHLSARATYAELSTLTPALAKRLSAILKEAGLQTFGPILMIQRGTSEDPTKPFDLEVGILAPKGTKPFGEAKVRTLPAFPCATTMASGDFGGESGKAAFMAVFQAAGEQGRIPTGEFREMLFFWEGEGSANNLMQIQIGLQ
jgi:hypothetical protein